MKTQTLIRKRIQKVGLLGSVLYPAWNLLIFWFLPEAKDSILQRLFVSLLFLGLWGMGFLKSFEKYYSIIFYAVLWLLTAHIFYLFHINLGHPLYYLFLILGILCISCVFMDRKMLIAYFVYCIAISFSLGSESFIVSPWFTFFSVTSALAASSVVQFDNLNMYEQLRIQNQNLEISLGHLKIGEKILRQAQELSKIGHFEINFSNNSRSWSEQAAVNFGLPPQTKMAEVDWKSLLDPSEMEKIRELWVRATQSKGTFDYQYKVNKPNGDTGFIHGLGKPTYSPTGDYIGFVGTLQDITDQVRLEQAFKDHIDKSAQVERLDAFGEMVGGVAHEINNPLTIIRGNAERLRMVLERVPLDTKIIQHISESTIHAVDRISQLISSMKMFVPTQVVTDVSAISTERILKSALMNCKTRIESLGVDLLLENDREWPIIDCRSKEISQIFVNILNNACDALRGVKSGKIYIKTRSFNNVVSFTFANNGPTIPLELRNKIFQPFFTTKELGQGYGLGLSVAQSIARNHHGTLFLDATASETSFRLDLPMHQT